VAKPAPPPEAAKPALPPVAAKPALPPEAIRSWAAQRFGAITAFHPLAEGDESQAFGFRAGDHDYVVRVNYEVDGFAKDRFAYERFNSRRVPVPEVVTIDAVDARHRACVARRLPGKTLQDSDIDTLTRLMRPVSAVLAGIGAADVSGTTGFGPFDGAGHGSYPSWRDYLVSVHRHARKPARPPVAADLIPPLLSAQDGLLDACPEQRRLVHGDFGSTNVLTDGYRVTGVLDWANAMYGDPLYDVAQVLFWAPWLDCMRIQAAHFRTVLPADPGTRARLLCYQLHIALHELLGHELLGHERLGHERLGPERLGHELLGPERLGRELLSQPPYGPDHTTAWLTGRARALLAEARP
jgi:hygromycin-B 4-O-kinase